MDNPLIQLFFVCLYVCECMCLSVFVCVCVHTHVHMCVWGHLSIVDIFLNLLLTYFFFETETLTNNGACRFT